MASEDLFLNLIMISDADVVGIDTGSAAVATKPTFPALLRTVAQLMVTTSAPAATFTADRASPSVAVSHHPIFLVVVTVAGGFFA